MNDAEQFDTNDPCFYYKLLGTDAVAELLGIHTAVLKLWVREGRFPAPVRFNTRLYRWPQGQVISFIKQHADAAAKENE